MVLVLIWSGWKAEMVKSYRNSLVGQIFSSRPPYPSAIGRHREQRRIAEAPTVLGDREPRAWSLSHQDIYRRRWVGQAYSSDSQQGAQQKVQKEKKKKARETKKTEEQKWMAILIGPRRSKFS